MGALIQFPGTEPAQIRLFRADPFGVNDWWDVVVQPPQPDTPILMRFAKQHEAIACGFTLSKERGWRFRCWEHLLDGGSAG